MHCTQVPSEIAPPDPPVARFALSGSEISRAQFRGKSLVAVLLLMAALAATVHQHERNGSIAPSHKDAEAKPTSPARDTPAAPLIKKAAVRGYSDLVVKTAVRYRIDPRLIHALIRVESAGNRFAVSSRGAKGLMQLTPAVCRKYAVRDPFDAEQNIRGGAAYLASLLKIFKGDTAKAIAAYNCGLKRVIENNGVPPGPSEQFVRKVLGRYEDPVVRELLPAHEPT